MTRAERDALFASSAPDAEIPEVWEGLEYGASVMDKFEESDARIMAFATCDDLDMPNPFFDEPLTKYDLGYIILVVDLLVIFTLFLFIYLIEVGQRNFIEIFNENTITPEDFTLKIKGMPDEALYSIGGGAKRDYRDETLKALLINHFESVLREEIELKKNKSKEKESLNASMKDFTDISRISDRQRAEPK